jgi:hypothetical protein
VVRDRAVGAGDARSVRIMREAGRFVLKGEPASSG